MYREYLPATTLEAYVDKFWTKIAPAGAVPVQRVLPDGCVDILFYLHEDPVALIVGTMTRAIVVANGAPQHIVAVRFRPGGAFAFLGIPLSELTDRSVDLDDVLPNMRGLGDHLAALKPQGPEAAVAELERALLRRLPGIVRSHPMVAGGIDLLLRQGQPARIGELADALGVSRQHLTRQFKVHVGIGPKELERVIRMTRLTRLLDGESDGRSMSMLPRAGKAPSAAQLAYELGYYDQSHMIHEFKSLAGVTPREYAMRERTA